MKRAASWIFANCEMLILLAMLSLWSLVWDYHQFGDFMRVGRIKFFLLATAAIASIRVAKTWHWTVGLFYLYVSCSFLHFGFMPWLLPLGKTTVLFSPDGFDEILCITACLFLIPVIAEKVTRSVFENAIIMGGLVQCIFAALNLNGIYIPKIVNTWTHKAPIGTLGHFTLLGPFLAFAFSIAVIRYFEAIDRRQRYLYAAVAAVNLIFALLTKSSMTYASLGAVTLVLFMFLASRDVILSFLLVVASAATALIYFDPEYGSLSGRLQPWRDAYSLYELRPWFGMGIGSWEPLAHALMKLRGQPAAWTYIHSDPIQGLPELGRVGMGIVAAAMVAVAARVHFIFAFRERTYLTWIAGVVVVGVNSFANFTLHVMPFGAIFALGVYQILQFGRPPERIEIDF